MSACFQKLVGPMRRQIFYGRKLIEEENTSKREELSHHSPVLKYPILATFNSTAIHLPPVLL